MSTQLQSHANNKNDAWERLANGLGWFSIGLGLSELIAAGPMANFIGVRNSSSNRSVLRAYGVREIGAGIGILAQQRPAGWLWARVAGDMLDIGSLASAVTSGGSKGGRLARSIAAVAGVTALDFYCASQMDRLPQSRGQDEQSRRASHAALITIDRPAADLYRQMREFMRTRGQGGESRVFTSSVEIAEDPGNQRLGWRARPAAGITVSGTVRFEPAPANRGTIVKAELDSPLTGAAGRVAGKLVRLAGGELLQNELRKFKQLVETGEIATSEATAETGIHEAQPPRELAHA
ncbi:MAG TPA: hypothetical protein VG345_00785 [Bryobacteraceae bacterium]|nr:hypothetical protein [Bryobacteraceae bacterium]